MRQALKRGSFLALMGAVAAAGLYAASRDGAGEAAVTRPAGAAVGAHGVAARTDGPPGAAGVRIYLDPETGEIRSRPVEEDAGRQMWPPDPTTRERLSRYRGDLLQESVPQGGFKVDLRGRFQSAVVATIDPQTDTVTLDCVTRPAAGEASHEK